MASLVLRGDAVEVRTDLSRRPLPSPTRRAGLLAPRPFVATTDPVTEADRVAQTFCGSFERGVAPTSQAAREIAALRPRTRESGGDLDALRRREHLVLDWLIRTYVPGWLRAARLQEAADRLTALSDTPDTEMAQTATKAVQNAETSARNALLEASADVLPGRVTFARDTARAAHYASAGIATTVAGGGVLGWPHTGDAASGARWSAAERAALDACTTVIVRAVASTTDVSASAQAAAHDTTAVLQRSAWRLLDRL